MKKVVPAQVIDYTAVCYSESGEPCVHIERCNKKTDPNWFPISCFLDIVEVERQDAWKSAEFMKPVTQS